jgi:hypothetical protein
MRTADAIAFVAVLASLAVSADGGPVLEPADCVVPLR